MGGASVTHAQRFYLESAERYLQDPENGAIYGVMVVVRLNVWPLGPLTVALACPS